MMSCHHRHVRVVDVAAGVAAGAEAVHADMMVCMPCHHARL